jgi:bacteriocin-like protein
MKIHFALNTPFAKRPEDQAITVLDEMELNEQELATVTGGKHRDGDRDGGDRDGGGCHKWCCKRYCCDY